MESVKKYYPNGELESEVWHNTQGVLHREDGPALIQYFNYNYPGRIVDEFYYYNGKIICDEFQPAYVGYVNGRVNKIQWRYSINNKNRRIARRTKNDMLEEIFYDTFERETERRIYSDALVKCHGK